MKPRVTFALIILTLLLTACDYISLAYDITPPPGYVSPTPLPTLEPVYPDQPPSPAAGASIYMEKCAACHGLTGLGDGQQGSQLSVPVPGLGLPDVATVARPADWFSIVKQGRIERFMPPFSGSLNDQKIWDVVSYAFTLSATPEQIAQGKTLYAANCVQCHAEDGSRVANADFTNQQYMAARTLEDFARAITNGANGMPAFNTLTPAETLNVAAYLRTLSFAQVAAAPATPTKSVADNAATATPESTPESGATPESTPESGATPGSTPESGATAEAQATEQAPATGSVKGTVALAAGGSLPANLEVTLHVFDHGADPNSAPVEIITQSAKVDKTGTFSFADIALGEGRFFYVDTLYKGIAYQSNVVISEPGINVVDLGETLLYESTSELDVLSLDQFHMFFDFAQEGSLTVSQVFIMSNRSQQTLVIESDLTSVPFVPLPANAVNFSVTSGEGPFVGTETGFAMPPSEAQYQLQIAFSVPYDRKVEISQPFLLKAAAGSVIVPEGVKLESKTLTAGQPQDIGGQQYSVYNLPEINVNDTITFTLSGKPSTGSTAANGMDANTDILLGIGAIGVALIAAGGFLYWRDRKINQEADQEDEADDEETLEPEQTADEVMDAIIALDDQFRNGNITQAAYEERRSELKAKLKEAL